MIKSGLQPKKGFITSGPGHWQQIIFNIFSKLHINRIAVTYLLNKIENIQLPDSGFY